MEQDNYQYLGLPGPRHIRLIHILPESDINNDDFQFDLEIHDIDNTADVEYICLSYTWGNPFGEVTEPETNIERQVKCGGKKFMVAGNLYQALRVLFGIKKLLWIDAICINQADLIERSAQVVLMGDIYANSYLVVIWLGPEDEDSKRAIPLVQSVAKSLGEVPSRQDLITLASTLPFNHDDVWKAMSHRPLTVEEWKSISALLCRTWFTRTWTVQETILSQRVALYCGNRRTSFTYLVEIGEFVMISNWLDHLRIVTERPKASYTVAFQLGQSKNVLDKGLSYPKQREYYRNFYGAETDSECLAAYCGWLWTSNRQRQATDPRDKIYAPLAIASRLKRPELALTWIVPDYTKSTGEVFTEAAHLLLRETKSLALLSNVEDKSIREQRNLPSWVPDYTIIQAPKSFNQYHGHLNASKGWDFEPDDHDPSSSLLPLTGIQVDIVATAAIPGLRSFPLLLTMVDISKYQGLSPVDLLIRTLLTGNLQDWRLPVTAPPHSYDKMVKSFTMHILFMIARQFQDPGSAFVSCMANPGLMQMLRSPPIRLPSEELINYFGAFFHMRGTPEWEQTFYTPSLLYSGMAEDMMDWRQLLVTSNERLLGYGPKSVQAQDEIWIFKGAKVPYLIRPCEDGLYEFVGEVYLEGLMQGEGITKWVHTGEKEEMIVVLK